MNRPSKLSYIDFAPRCAGGGGIVCNPDYERFDVLVGRANLWLRQNGEYRAKVCESIEVKGRYDGVVDTTKSSYFEADHVRRKIRNMYIRALRLWVVPREPDDPPGAQQIGYVNVVPARSHLGAIDCFGDTLAKFNRHLRERPLQGKVLNVETQEMKFHEWGVGADPDESCWVESVKFNVSFLVVIRVFYELGLPAYEEIGCADFVPALVERGSQLAGATSNYEHFGEVVNKASIWLEHQANIRVTNIQSVDYKQKHGTETDAIDTQRSFFVESGRLTTRYLRILRICFVRRFHENGPLDTTPVYLSYLTFQPLMLSTGGIIGIPIFEVLADTMRRAMSWLNKHPDLEVISAETVPVRMYSGNQYGNHEITYTWNRGEQKEVWLLVLRIYVNGQYAEPPPDMRIVKSSSDNPKKSNYCCTLL